MFKIRNIGGVALLLFGTTFLWITPAFASAGISTEGIMWTITQILALATLAGFLAATWGLFRRDRWWHSVAVGSAILGLITLAPYLVAAVTSGETTPWFTAAILALGCGGVLTLLLVPRLDQWVTSHVMGGPRPAAARKGRHG